MFTRLMLGAALLALVAAAPWQSVAAQASGAEMSAEQVRIIQWRLFALGFDPGTRDGAWGEQTVTALREFQQFHGIEADGEPGDLTLRMLGLSSAIEEAASG